MKGIKERGRDLSEKEVFLRGIGLSPSEKHDRQGSVTVEAAIVLPVFLCFLFSIVFFIRVVYTHEIIQHAVAEAAGEMASVSYLYHVGGLHALHDTVRDGIKSNERIFEEHFSSIFDAYGSLAGKEDSMEEAADNPVALLKSVVFKLIGGEFDDLKTEVCIPVIKLFIQKYLTAGQGINPDARLKSLHIVNGFNGLDFSGSRFFEDDENNIDIVVRYRIAFPFPLRIFPELDMVQRATVKAWLDGDGSYLPPGEDTQADDIWSLNNFQRGMKLRTLYGANLPSNFPVIARFQSGTATMIKSIDLTAASYRDALTVRDKICEYIDRLRAFEGQEKPWGSEGIVISRKDIKARELLLVIPGNSVAPEVEAALEWCRAEASSKGVVLRVERHGYKREADNREEGEEE